MQLEGLAFLYGQYILYVFAQCDPSSGVNNRFVFQGGM